MIQLFSHQYGVEGVGLSMQGGRTENQDDFGCIETPLGFLIVVCDGMGGGPGGKTASYLVKTAVFETFSKCSSLASPFDVIKLAVDCANETLGEHVKKIPELEGMGSTLVLLLIGEKSAFVAHLGDSRCYQLRENKLVFRTKDHSVVGELVRNGALSEEQARTSPQSNIITRGLGSTTNHVAEIVELPYQKGDRFVLCTDGVWGIMPHEDLMMRLTNRQSIGEIVRSLNEEIDQIGASQGNHHDNHTLIVLEMKNNSLLVSPLSSKVKALLCIGLGGLIISVIFNIVCFINYGINPQLKTLQFKNDSLKSRTVILDSIIEEKDMEIGHLVTLNDKLEETVRDGSNTDQQVRARLLYQIELLYQKIDSLDRIVKHLRDEKVLNNSDLLNKQLSNSINEEGRNPHVLLSSCESLLKDLARKKWHNQRDATQTVRKSIDEVIKKLEKFNDITSGNYKNIINQVVNKLKNDNKFRENKNITSAGQNGNLYFEVKNETKQAINDIVKKLREVNNKIK